MKTNRHGLPILPTVTRKATSVSAIRDKPSRLELYYDRLCQIHQIANRQAQYKAKDELDRLYNSEVFP